jgi:hypothetical protein
MFQSGECLGEHALREVAVHYDGVAASCAPAFEPVEWTAVERLEQPALGRKQLVGEVTVEDDARAGLYQAQERYAGAELVDKEGRGREPSKLVGEDGDLKDKMHLAENGAQDGEAAEEGGGHDGVAAHAHIEGSFTPASGSLYVSLQPPCRSISGRRQVEWGLTIARFVEAMPWVAVRCEDGDLVPALLQRDSGIDNKTLSAANAEVRMEEDGVLLVLCHV